MLNEQTQQNQHTHNDNQQTKTERSSVNKFAFMAAETPALRGELRGSSDHPAAEGSIFAYWLDGALYIQAEFVGLPPDRIFGFHIHNGIVCGSPDASDGNKALKDAGSHLSLCRYGGLHR